MRCVLQGTEVGFNTSVFLVSLNSTVNGAACNKHHNRTTINNGDAMKAHLLWISGLALRVTSSAFIVAPSSWLHPSTLNVLPTSVEEDQDSSAADCSRRRVFQTSLAFSAVIHGSVKNSPAFADTESVIPTPPLTKDLSWPIGKVAFSLLPLAGTSSRRATVEECIVPDTIWTHDQIQGVVNVNVPVRQTVVRLKEGGLWVYNPVAPTPQLLGMMERLVDKYGPVKHIVLGTVALEHKATLPAFASHFPAATVWLQPGQWAFPVDVPIEFYGLVQRGPRLREIPVSGRTVPLKYQSWAKKDPIPEWTEDFDYEVLGPFSFKSVGGFSETAFFHKDTKTLLVTDSVVSITKDAPPIIQEDPRGLLYHARDNAFQRVEDTPETRQKGWRRMVQFGLVFFPSQISVDSVGQAFAEARKVPADLRNLGDGAIPFGALYPWSWNGDSDKVNFETISENGKLFCPPILTKLILDREPNLTLDFVDRVTKRFKDMERIIPCHLNNNIRVSGSREFYEAFDPLRSRPDMLVAQRALAEDLALLQKASDLLTTLGVVAPSQICDGEPARKKGRFANRKPPRLATTRI